MNTPPRSSPGEGCGIYATRPKVCRVFNCAWRMGFGTPSERPDLSGVIFTTTLEEAQTRGISALVAHETSPGSLDDNGTVAKYAEVHPIFLRMKDGRKLLGPKQQVEHIRRMAGQWAPQDRT